MNSNDGPRAYDAESDVDDREVARLVSRYTGANEGDDLGELPEKLDELIRGDIVDINPEGAGIIVIVEQVTEKGGEPIRDAYAIRSVTSLEEEPALDWSYLGRAK